MDNAYVLNKVVQGRLKVTYAFFLDVKELMTLCGMMACG